MLALRAQEQPQADSALEQDPVRKFGLLAFWASFITYATFLAPNVNPEASTALLPELFKLPGENTVNPVFLAIFGMLGVWPAVMAALVIPLQPKAQSLKAWPFVTASFGLGAFGLTPYLALTSYDQSAEVDSDSAVASFVGSRGFGKHAQKIPENSLKKSPVILKRDLTRDASLRHLSACVDDSGVHVCRRFLCAQRPQWRF